MEKGDRILLEVRGQIFILDTQSFCLIGSIGWLASCPRQKEVGGERLEARG
jgi:hypothetical protein